MFGSVIQDTHLNPLEKDNIRWNLTNDGVYSAISAYHVQFNGSFPRFKAEKIWTADAEPKCKLFSWLALHGKILTTDMLYIGGWPHDPTCKLCGSAPETVAHLCKDCPFMIAVWNTIQAWDNETMGNHGTSFPSISEWWDDMIIGRSKLEQNRRSGRLLYTLWNAWKERNHRIFTGRRLTYIEVASITRDDISMRATAFAMAGPAIPAEPN
uniref:Uncharacterized protein n=1 Tax=Avena sativa TaxID=4498 RepID=A0ACD5V4B4_AVESA